jgi:hypothetical protein
MTNTVWWRKAEMARRRRRCPPARESIADVAREIVLGDLPKGRINCWDCAAWALLIRLLPMGPELSLQIIRKGLTGDYSPVELGFNAAERPELVASVLYSAQFLLARYIERNKNPPLRTPVLHKQVPHIARRSKSFVCK